MIGKYIYSHLNGLDWFQVHHPKLWKEILDTIKAVAIENCRTKKVRRRQ